MAADKKMIFISHQRHKGGNRDYCSHFSVIFETTTKFPIVFGRLILGKVGVEGFTCPRRESDGRKKSDFTLIKGIRVEIEIIVAIFSDISKQQVNFQLLL